MAGKKGRSGAKRQIGRAITDYLESIKNDALPEILDSMVERAKAGDKELQMYLCDRVLGRPRQEIDQKIKGAILLVTPDEYEIASRAAKDTEAALLTAGAATGEK